MPNSELPAPSSCKWDWCKSFSNIWEKLELKLCCCSQNTALFALISSASLSQERPCPCSHPHLGLNHHSWEHTGVLPTLAVSSLKGRQGCDCHPAGHLTACIGRAPLTLSLVNPGKAFIEHHKSLALELLEPVFPRLGTTCLGHLWWGGAAATGADVRARPPWAVWGSARLLWYPMASLISNNASQLTYLCLWGRAHGNLAAAFVTHMSIWDI